MYYVVLTLALVLLEFTYVTDESIKAKLQLFSINNNLNK